MKTTPCTTHRESVFTHWVLVPAEPETPAPIAAPSHQPRRWPSVDIFQPLRTWLNNLDVRNATVAHFTCKLIPAQCPFARDITVFGRVLLSIPPLCKLNPVYDQVVALRFRALCYLADECGEDITPYC